VTAQAARKYGTFLGVFTPSMLTILGTIMYLRFGWVVGNAGIYRALAIVLLANVITLVTALSVSSLATSQRVGVGGAYFLISRSLGLEVGGAIGLPLYLSQAISLTLYCYGLAEAIMMPFGVSNQPLEIGLAVLFIVLVTFGALRATAILLKTQVLILVFVGLSIFALAFGADWAAPIVVEEGNYGTAENFWGVFAVFFPAVTGILTGLSLSGDLKDPEKSIPWGTLGAVLVGFGIYLIIPIALAHHQDPAALRENQLVWTEVALGGGWLIWPGLIMAIVSSAIGSILAAPRTLQALANDGVLPRYIGKTTDGEPKFAMYISSGVALLAVMLGDLNAVATVVTLFFLTTYGMINVVNLLEELSGNPSFRPRMRIHWSFSLSAALGCFWVMFLINPVASMLAFVVEIAIYFVLSRRAMKATWGDMRAGAMMSLTRWSLLRQRNMEEHSRNWRPNILVFSSSAEKDLQEIRLASRFSQGRGIITVACLRIGDLDNLGGMEKEARESDRFLKENGIDAFCEVDVVPDLPSGILSVVQANGIAGLQSNTVVFGWPSTEEFPVDLTKSMRRLDRLGKSLLIVRMQKANYTKDPTIDVWWSGAKDNGDLMLLLAYLLTLDYAWQSSEIRLKTIVDDIEELEERERALQRICNSTRIQATPRVVVRKEDESVPEVIRRHSAGAGLVFLGLSIPVEGEEIQFGRRLSRLVSGLPSVVLVRNSGPFRGELIKAE
jgi:solute carrier family 12 (potassium/chloride transporter), member 4/6